MSPAAWVADKAIAGYQVVFAGRQSPCRHIPSCSVYGREAVAEHGAVKGLWLTTRRIGRCNPWGTHGLDLVPPASRPLAKPDACSDSTADHLVH